jgi:hypothetical protein
MTAQAASGPVGGPQGLDGPPGFGGTAEVRAALRRGLTAALKARDPDTVAALRVAIAAIDNAEAVPAPDSSASALGLTGLGAGEASRRQLSAVEVRDILNAQVTERVAEANQYDALGQSDAAERLRRQARALAPYLPQPPDLT